MLVSNPAASLALLLTGAVYSGTTGPTGGHAGPPCGKTAPACRRRPRRPGWPPAPLDLAPVGVTCAVGPLLAAWGSARPGQSLPAGRRDGQVRRAQRDRFRRAHPGDRLP